MSSPTPGTGGPARLIDDDGLATQPLRVASMPASNETTDATLRLVTSLAQAMVHGADGVSVSLERHGTLATVAASNALATRIDQYQYDAGQGPCVAAAAEGQRFHIDALHDETRWPAFVPLAIEAGIGSVLSNPLVVAGQPIGALNMHSRSESAFATDQQELAALFALQASSVLTAFGAHVTDREQDTLMATALRSRELLSQAEGVLMARRGIDAHDAAALLYRWARVAETTVLAQAMEVVASTIGLGPDA